MKKTVILITIIFGIYSKSKAQTFNYTNPRTTHQSGYTKSNGTYVEPTTRTSANNTNWDNYSTHGNTNPNTGSEGSRARDYSDNALNYGSGNTIQTGSRGGRYYINDNGNKVYVPKEN